MRKITNRDLRKALHDGGVERVRIKTNGEVHCLGKMPNTNQRGWYLKGYDYSLRWELEEERRITEIPETAGHMPR